MRILFIGGSNTAIAGGYTRDFIAAIQEALDEPVTFDNIAVGGNPCLLGLQQVLAREDLEYDLFVLEYLANDFGITAEEAGFRTWRAGYEAIIRVLRRRRPQALILSILLGRRSSRDDARIARLAAEVERLSEHYGTSTVDVHSFLTSRAADEEQRSSLFRDNAHFTEPYISALAGLRAATAILPPLLRPRGDALPLPPKLAPVTFEHATVTPLPSLAPEAGPATTFENSRYRVDALRLTPDDGAREVLLPGALISLGFVSTPDAGRLLLHEPGRRPVTADTHSDKVFERKHRFLLKTMNFATRDWSPAEATPRRVRLQVVAPDAPGSAEAEHLPLFNMVPPKPGTEPAVYLTTALCFALPEPAEG